MPNRTRRRHRRRPRQNTFSSMLSRSDLSQKIDQYPFLASYQWLQNGLNYFGTMEIAGSLSEPLIVQFIATTTGRAYQAQTGSGTFMEISAETRMPLMCSIGFDFNRTTRRGRRGRHLDEEVTHWCSAFVNHVMIRSGFSGTHSLGARSWHRWGRRIRKREIEDYFGAVAVFTRPSKTNPHAGHVGFYVGETRNHYLIFGGNQSNSVCVKKYRKSRLLSFRWPS